jgi:hypothetical protein
LVLTFPPKDQLGYPDLSTSVKYSQLNQFLSVFEFSAVGWLMDERLVDDSKYSSF